MTHEDINTLIRQMTEEAGTYQRVGTATTFRTAKMLSCAAILLADMQRDRESEHTVAAEVMLLEAERQIDQLKERGEVYRRGFNRVRLERNEYRKGLEHLLWVIDKMMCALEDDFVKTVCCVANEVNQQIKRKLKK